MKETARTSFEEIGARLRAHRLGMGLSPDALADRIGISRAALYRAEKGGIAKVDMLTAIARELNVSLPTLLGVGIEYIPNAVAFFERMRQIEEGAEQIIGLFSPVSYLLTTRAYDRALAEVFAESVPATRQAEATKILEILAQRKDTFHRRKPSLASIISASEIERFLRSGLEGRTDLPPAQVVARRSVALAEVRHVISLLRNPEIGVQLGVSSEPFPSTSFQIVRGAGAATLTVSPFRLGHNPNITVGVGFISSAPEAVELHEGIARNLWDSSMRGAEAAEQLEHLIERYRDAAP
ncbi:helix-turn-helix transcriptional regulator [Phaeovulum sp. NW3]|uniref:helix-turn-helix domain-containing protein n=1 Tax=Phaeovulum sp. NW3 TaxID=2934933 RepID=UPI0020201E0F|nr:helix-turn-helix transcriptional regulator [Phaeovulum sp. NW3]MCL7466653.1 helix-turn-helix domain-containing protein [Phaeovulum sp. NW3]